MIRRFVFLSFFVIFSVSPASAQQDDPQKFEFRGVWMASVLNLDWPAQGVHPFFLTTSLINMLDALKDAGINAVIFQVRPEADALYEPGLEPWSFWLTGEQGRAPDPFFDPLAFIIEETHKRGMELHAWFNPYRAIRGSGYENAPDHIAVTHPEWTLTFGNLVLLDPGLQDVRDHISNVILDVIRRYDVDGVHFDDFFYPYPPNEITIEDIETFNEHSRGFTNIHDWRRDNVNLLIAQVSDSLNAIKPYLKFGISPFGIWKDGVPSGIVGLDAANVIYGDALAWLQAQTIDYIAPQLYWAFGGGQDYGKLAPWWAGQTNGRHIYTGHGLYRSDRNTFSGMLFSASEVPDQVRFNRQRPDIHGSIFFRTKNITSFSSKGFADSLEINLNTYPALTPPMIWKDMTAPAVPQNLAFELTGVDEVVLSWDRLSAGDEAAIDRYALYRVRSSEVPDFRLITGDARNLLAVTGDTSFTDSPGIAGDPYYYAVTAVSRNSIESEPSNVVFVEGQAVSVETERPAAFELYQNFPNPFSTYTEIRFRLERPETVSLYVYDALGRKVATLIEEQSMTEGMNSVRWEGVADSSVPLGSGNYYYRLYAGTYRITKGMVLLR